MARRASTVHLGIPEFRAIAGRTTELPGTRPSAAALRCALPQAPGSMAAHEH
jgi:hypothetical protein